jgi:hypothetical protein
MRRNRAINELAEAKQRVAAAREAVQTAQIHREECLAKAPMWDDPKLVEANRQWAKAMADYSNELFRYGQIVQRL